MLWLLGDSLHFMKSHPECVPLCAPIIIFSVLLGRFNLLGVPTSSLP